MKIVLVDLAAKYIHTGLATRYLYQSGPAFARTVLLEKTINQPVDQILADIYREKPDVVGFSCYIWNIDHILRLGPNIKALLPQATIILGGPEVSYSAQELLADHRWIDFIICGEGEESWPELLECLRSKADLTGIAGLCFRLDNHIIANEPACCNLHKVPNPYDHNTLKNTANRIIYYECSRGCPYNCSYCLSGLAGKVRLLPLSRIKKELYYLAVEKNVQQIKFVDRTFNHNKTFATEIFSYLKELPSETSYHFEMRADLIDDNLLGLLRDVPAGRFQFEIGIQSTNPQTLQAINRTHNWPKLSDSIQSIKKLGTIHQHLDLIAGLPYEDYASFVNSFNQVYNLQPEMLQLGFLKLIKGSPLWHQREEFGYNYRSYPPYEVLANSWISYPELLRLKDLEAVLELFYNSGNFAHTLKYIVAEDCGFRFYEGLGDWFRKNRLFEQKHSLETLFQLLYSFISANYPLHSQLGRELLKLDFLKHFKHRQLPECLEHIEVDNYTRWVSNLLADDGVRQLLAPEQRNLAVRDILKFTHFETFSLNPLKLKPNQKPCLQKTVLLFDYSHVSRKWHQKKAQAFALESITVSE